MTATTITTTSGPLGPWRRSSHDMGRNDAVGVQPPTRASNRQKPAGRIEGHPWPRSKRRSMRKRRDHCRIDILVNNAGTNIPEPIDRITDENWDNVMEINLTSVMSLTRALVPQMKERRWGRVIHISSVMGLVSKEGRNIYSATKSALLGLARANALDLGAFGITVNCILPGPFLTDLPGRLLSDQEKKAFADQT